jgi:hypothetical protein
MKAISKELFIMALLLMIVVFMVGIIFYEYMPNNKTVPEPEMYSTDASTTAVLQEIAAISTTSNSTSETQSVIKSYSIGAKELSTAESKQSYTSGKTDPFAEYVAPATNEISNTTADGNTTSSNGTTNTTGNTSTTGSSSSNKNSSSSSTTGTFFEKSNSK